MRSNKMITKRKFLDLLSNFLNTFFKKIYRDQFGEFVCGYWGLKGEPRARPNQRLNFLSAGLLTWVQNCVIQSAVRGPVS